MSTLADAIAKAEGFGVPGAIPTLANNPGDLALGDQGFGTMGANITIFPTLQDGQTALESQVTAMLSGTSKYYNPNETIAQVGQTYAGGNTSWARNVANFFGVPQDATLSEAIGGAALGASGMYGTNLSTNKETGGSILASRGLEDYIVILVGLILIAAGVFAFDTTRTVITKVGRISKTAAEVAA